MRGRVADLVVDRLCPGAIWLTPILSRSLPAIAGVLSLSLLAAAAGLATPMVTKAVIDQGIMAGDMSALLFWAAVSFAIGLAMVGFGIVSAMAHLRASMALLGRLRLRVLAAAARRDPAAPPLNVGEAQTRIDGDSAEIQRFLFDTVLVAVTAMFRLVGGTVLMISLDWRLALLPALAAPLELWFLRWARPETERRAEAVRDGRGALNGQLAETFVQFPGLRALGALGQRSDGFGRLQTRVFDAQARQRLWTEGVAAVSTFLTAAMRAAVLLLGGWLVIRGDWPIGSLVAFLAYSTMMAGPLRNLLGLYHAQARARVSLRRLSALVDDSRDPRAGLSCATRPARLAFDGARSAIGRHAPVSATLRAGERILLDGPSGIGKTGLVAAALGEAALAEGGIAIDGVPVERLSLDTRRRAITHLPQHPVVLHGTLRDNLAASDAGPSDRASWRMLRTCDLASWAADRAGLDTPLAEAGANLSGGLRQRIALARALLRPSGIFVFDESFSEIDAAAATRILDAIERTHSDRLRIFISHAGPVRAGHFDHRITLGDPAAPGDPDPAHLVRAKP